MSAYYFVAFESRSKPDGLVKTVSNVILKDVHPVVWLANPPDDPQWEAHPTGEVQSGLKRHLARGVSAKPSFDRLYVRLVGSDFLPFFRSVS